MIDRNELFEAMVSKLKSQKYDGNDIRPTRKHLIKIVKIIRDHLGVLMAIPIDGGLAAKDGGEDALEVYIRHSIDMSLSALIGALEDLEIGKTDPMFLPYKHGANASRAWHRKQMDNLLVENLKILKRHRGLRTDNEAAKLMVRLLKQSGRKFGGEFLTPKELIRKLYL